jgi:multiple sugar transport system permease protein
MTQTAVPPQAAPRTPALPATRRPPGFLSVGWFTGPYLVAFALFLAIPAAYGLWMSFTDQSLTGRETSFVGFANYAEALSDSKMWSALGNTLFFTVITTVPLVAVSLAMALLVATGLPGQWLWRLSYFAPFLLTSAVVSAMWLWIFQPGGGLVTGVLEYLGVAEIGWLTEEGVAMWSIAIVTLWWTVGFNFLLYLAAIQAIPDHLYEAAAIDGAGPLRRLTSITLPMLRRTTGLILLLQVLASLKVFDQIYLITKGGPNDSTRPILEYIYDVGFTGYRLGYASAISVIFFVLIMLISLVQVVRSRREG